MKTSDCWQTPQAIFDELDAEFHFDIDLCASKDNSKCVYYYSEEKSYLSEEVLPITSRQCAFMNPPYSNPRPFIEKAGEDSKRCKIVCLVKCDPSTRWWATFWEYGVECPQCPSYSRGKVVKYIYREDSYGNGYEGRQTIVCNMCKGAGKYTGPKPG
jgi:phage N-6-adenine-methyltransferase